MTQATSPGTGRVYDIQQVCAAFGVPRSSFYWWREQKAAEGPSKPPEALPAVKRGPKPKMTDAELLVHIRDDLATSPFQGEGHRKVFARLSSRARGTRLAQAGLAHHAREPAALAVSRAEGPAE